jgi:hypothetical protein
VTAAGAYKKASQRARETLTDRYVVWSVEDTDRAGEHYHVATEEAVDTFYLGATIAAVFGPEGEQG